LRDVHNNAIANADQATTAGTVDWSVGIKTTSGTVDDIAIWLDPDNPQNRELSFQLRSGGYKQAWNETEGLAKFGGSLSTLLNTLDFRRVVAAVASPERLVRGWVSWDDTEGGRARMEFRGAYRINQPVLYEAYTATAADPVPGVDSPFDTSPTVPWTPPDAFGDEDDYRLALVQVNRYGLRASPRTIVRRRIVSGVDSELLPNDPASASVAELANGFTRVVARYVRPANSGRKATHFHVWFTTDGSTPGDGEPDFEVPVRFAAGGGGILDLRDIPQQTNGTTVKVLVKMRRATTVISASGLNVEKTIDTDGPSAPIDGSVLP
jgi:hypothetical protein